MQHRVVSETRQRNPRLQPLDGRYLVKIVAVALLYFGVAKFGFLFAFTTKQVTAVWPPTGIALVSILILGYRIFPGVFLGALLINSVSDEPLLTAAGIAVGNTLGPLLGAFLLNRVVKVDHTLTRLRDTLGLLLFGAIVGMTVTATNGVLNLALAHIVPWSAYAAVWWIWWIGDVMGVLLVAPCLLTWAANPRLRWKRWRVVEFAVLFCTLFVVSQIVFASTTPQLHYAVFPFIIWAALRFGQRETASVILLLGGVAVWGAVHNRGPFSSGTLDERLVLLEAYTAVVAVAGLVLGAVTAERRRAEEALRRAHDELEERIRERTAEIERLRAEWNSIIAHDLRQPIAAITMNAQFLMLEIAADSHLYRPTERISDCARRLNRLVRELVDFSQLQSRQLELTCERVDLRSLVSASVDVVAQEAPDRRFQMTAHGEIPPIKADADRIAQVIDNLLSNAIKYGTPESPIVVEIDAADDIVRVSVTNDGVGIDPEDLPHLFQRFARTNQAKRSRVKGLGLGLYIVRELIEAHGGEVDVSSTPGGSTTFRFTLPIG
jgi:signal transduction histidine kinase